MRLGSAAGAAHVSGGYADGDRLTNIQNVVGSNWNDILSGTIDNRLSGGAGNDVLRIQGTPSLVDGGDGTDTLSITKSTAVLDDTNFTGIERVVVASGGGVDMSGVTEANTPALIRSQSAVNARTAITGSQGDDRIFSGKGSDTLVGGLGSDRLYGGTGSTTFQSTTLKSGVGDGNDVMYAGSGKDTFNELMAGFGRDLIYNADLSTDFINVSGLGSDYQMIAINGGQDTLIYGDAGHGVGTDQLVLKGVGLSTAQDAQASGHIFSTQSL